MRVFQSILITACLLTASISGGLAQGDLLLADSIETLEFDFEHGMLFTTVTIETVPYRFIIDSGSPTAIDVAVQDEFDFPKQYKVKFKDAAGLKRRIEIVEIDQLKLGGIVLSAVHAGVTDFSGFKCLNIDGIIGADIMQFFDWEIDYESEIATLHRYGIPKTRCLGIGPNSVEDVGTTFSLRRRGPK